MEIWPFYSPDAANHAPLCNTIPSGNLTPKTVKILLALQGLRDRSQREHDAISTLKQRLKDVMCLLPFDIMEYMVKL